MVVPTIVCEDGSGFLCIDIIYFKIYIIIMAKNVINEKGFKVIKLSPNEAKAIGFGFQDEIDFELICDNCNELMLSQDCYYVACLNRALCSECFDEWYDNAVRYPEDIRWETNKYNHTILRLEANGIILEDEEYGR